MTVAGSHPLPGPGCLVPLRLCGGRPGRRRWPGAKGCEILGRMMPDEAVDRGFLDGIGALADQPLRSAALPVGQTTSLTGTRCLEIFGSQLASRHLDLAARVLRREGKGFYTIGSAGHEANAFVASVLRPTDPALLHYRSGAFFAERARQVRGQDPIRDTLLGVVAAADEPIAGGATRCSAARPSR